MSSKPYPRRIEAALTLGLALSLPTIGWAQQSATGTGGSSGGLGSTGAGTSPGGAGATGTGTSSGGLGATGTGISTGGLGATGTGTSTGGLGATGTGLNNTLSGPMFGPGFQGQRGTPAQNSIGTGGSPGSTGIIGTNTSTTPAYSGPGSGGTGSGLSSGGLGGAGIGPAQGDNRGPGGGRFQGGIGGIGTGRAQGGTGATGTGTSAGGTGATGPGGAAGGLGATGLGGAAGGLDATGARGPAGGRGSNGTGTGGTGNGGQPAANVPAPLDTMRDSTFGAPSEGVQLTPEDIAKIEERLLPEARAIRPPNERAIALTRVARAKIFGQNLDDAHIALREAGQAAVLVQDEANRDRRLMEIVTALVGLADSDVREGTPTLGSSSIDLEARPIPSERGPLFWIKRAEQDWDYAATLAVQIPNPNHRSEMLFRLSEDRAIGSQAIALTAAEPADTTAEATGLSRTLNDLADHNLARAADHARQIDRTVWRDRALTTIVSHGASAGQFARSKQIVGSIFRAEYRTEALLRIADNQSRYEQTRAATQTYREAAQAVASIPQPDPRMILTGVLIDSLISAGRFDDARASIVLYTRETNRVAALGAIAESMGRRGRAQAARDWIERDAPEAYRPLLKRRVIDGVLASLEQTRTSALNAGATVAPIAPQPGPPR